MQYYCELSVLLYSMYSFPGSTPITVVRIVDGFTFATCRQDFVFDRPLHCRAVTILAVSHPHIRSLLFTTGWLLVVYMFNICIRPVGRGGGGGRGGSFEPPFGLQKILYAPLNCTF